MFAYNCVPDVGAVEELRISLEVVFHCWKIMSIRVEKDASLALKYSEAILNVIYAF